jgi:hypothetical protein
MALIKINNRSSEDTAIHGRRNLIINGAMQVSQRGTSLSSISSDNNFLVDRYKFKVTSAGTWTISQDTDVPSGEGFNHSFKADCTSSSSLSSNSQLRFIYTPEGQDMAHFEWGTSNAKSLTLSFWIKTNKTGTYALTWEASQGGGRYYQTTYSVSTADTWEKKTITIVGDSDTGETYNSNNDGFFALSWWFGGGSSINNAGTPDTWVTDADYSDLIGNNTLNLADSTDNYFNITGIQMELGDVATPFEHRLYGEELALCQRYFYKEGGTYDAIGVGAFTASTSELSIQFSFPVEMRARPAVTTSTISNFEFRKYDNTQVTLGGSTQNIDLLTPNGGSVWRTGESLGAQDDAGLLRSRSGTEGFFFFDAEI